MNQEQLWDTPPPWTVTRQGTLVEIRRGGRTVCSNDQHNVMHASCYAAGAAACIAKLTRQSPYVARYWSYDRMPRGARAAHNAWRHGFDVAEVLMKEYDSTQP